MCETGKSLMFSDLEVLEQEGRGDVHAGPLFLGKLRASEVGHGPGHMRRGLLGSHAKRSLGGSLWPSWCARQGLGRCVHAGNVEEGPAMCAIC